MSGTPRAPSPPSAPPRRRTWCRDSLTSAPVVGSTVAYLAISLAFQNDAACHSAGCEPVEGVGDALEAELLFDERDPRDDAPLGQLQHFAELRQRPDEAALDRDHLQREQGRRDGELASEEPDLDHGPALGEHIEGCRRR